MILNLNTNEMRKIIINLIFFALLGVVLNHLGLSISSWEFWVITLLMVLVGINSESE